jgi:hypothetical protein
MRLINGDSSFSMMEFQVAEEIQISINTIIVYKNISGIHQFAIYMAIGVFLSGE